MRRRPIPTGWRPGWVATVFLVGFLMAGPSLGQSVADWVAALAKPRLQGAGIEAAGKKLRFGHLELELLGGRLYPVFAAGRPAGVFFEGQGRFRYRSEDPYEAPFVAENVREGSRYSMGSGSIGDTVQRLLVFTSGGTGAFTSDPWPEGEAPAAVLESFRKHRRQWLDDQFLRAEHLVAQGWLEPDRLPMVQIEIAADRHDLVWTFDPLRNGLETLAVLHDSESDLEILKGYRYPRYVSTQAIGRDRLEPPPHPFTVTDLDVELVNPEGRKARISVRQTVRADTDLGVLAFGLDTTVLGTVGATGVPEELSYRVVSMTDGSGRALAYSHRDDDLLVQPNERLAPGDTIELRAELAGDILYRPNNDNYWRLTSNWYPTPDYWEMEAFTFHAVVKVAKPFRAFASGRLVKRWKEDGLECAEFREELPIAGPGMMAGKYHTVEESSGDYTVRVSSYATTQPRAAKTLAGLTLGFIEFFEPYLGRYPFREIDVVEINSLGFGQAPAGIIYITREAFEPRTDQSTRLYSEGINARMAHEVAHAWWGHVARLATPEDQWMSESIAEYYSAVAMGSLKGDREFDTALSHWMRGAKDGSESASIYMGNYVTGDKAFRQRFRLLYEKGPVMLHALRQELGDDPFFTILKSFLRSFPGQPARTKDFIGLSSFVAQRDLRPWFDRYLFGLEMPEIEK